MQNYHQAYWRTSNRITNVPTLRDTPRNLPTPACPVSYLSSWVHHLTQLIGRPQACLSPGINSVWFSSTCKAPQSQNPISYQSVASDGVESPSMYQQNTFGNMRSQFHGAFIKFSGRENQQGSCRPLFMCTDKENKLGLTGPPHLMTCPVWNQ